MMRPWKLAETNYGTSRTSASKWPCCRSGPRSRITCTCPTASTRSKATPSAKRLCEAAWQQGAKVVLLPTIPYGTQTNQMEFPLADERQPFDARRGDHRPGRFARPARHPEDRAPEQPRRQRPEAGCCASCTARRRPTCSFATGTPSAATSYDEIFDEPDDHAGEMETSFALAYCPELVGRTPDGRLTADEGRHGPQRGSRRSTAAGSRSPGPGTC